MKRVLLMSVVLLSTVYGCGGGGGGSTTGSGKFVDSPVGGMNYQSGGESGITDSDGGFRYEIGKPVTFFIGGVQIGQPVTINADAATISPIDLVPNASGVSNSTVTNISRFLQSIDDDGDSSNGIAITQKVANAVANSHISSANFQETTTLFAQNIASDLIGVMNARRVGGGSLVSANTAQAHLTSTLNALPKSNPPGTNAGGSESSNDNSAQITQLQRQIDDIKQKIDENNRLIDIYDANADRLEAMGASLVTIMTERNRAIALAGQNVVLAEQWGSLSNKLAALMKG